MAQQIVEEERLAMSTSRARRLAPKSSSTVVVTLSMLPAELLLHVLTFLLFSEAARALPAFPWVVRALAVKKEAEGAEKGARASAAKAAAARALAELMFLMVNYKCDDVAFLYQGPGSPLYQAARYLGNVDGFHPKWVLTSSRAHPPSWFVAHLAVLWMEPRSPMYFYDMAADVRALVKAYAVFGEPWADPSHPYGEPSWSVVVRRAASASQGRKRWSHASYAWLECRGGPHSCRLEYWLPLQKFVRILATISMCSTIGHVNDDVMDHALGVYFSEKALPTNALLPSPPNPDHGILDSEEDKDDPSYHPDDDHDEENY